MQSTGDVIQERTGAGTGGKEHGLHPGRMGGLRWVVHNDKKRHGKQKQAFTTPRDQLAR